MEVAKKEKRVTKTPFNDVFLCGLCNELSLDPLECPDCGTIVCSRCSGPQPCPNCKKVFAPLSKAILKMYNDIEVKCSKPSCGKFFPASGILAHENTCFKTECANIKHCGKTFSRSEFTDCCSLKCALCYSALSLGSAQALFARVQQLMKGREIQIDEPMRGESQGSKLVKVPTGKVTWHRKSVNIKYVGGDESVIMLDEAGYVYRSAVANLAMEPGGQYYWQVTSLDASQTELKVGITDDKFDIENAFCNYTNGYAFYGIGQLRHNSNSTGPVYGKSFKRGAVLGIFLDTLKGELSYSLNGENLGLAFKDDALKRTTFYAAVSLLKKAGCSINYNVPLPAFYNKTQ